MAIPRAIHWRQPEPWTVAFVLLTGIVVVGRHPIARAIGTEVDVTSSTPSVVASAAPAPSVTPTQAAVAAALAAVPTHAPRDPFASLVGAGAAVAAPDAASATAKPRLVTEPTWPTTQPDVSVPNRAAASAAAAAVAPAQPATAAPSHHRAPAGTATGAASSCTGTMHTVVSGDTLWSLAARSVKSADTGKVTVAWHRIYRANRPPLSDPSMLPVGTKICLPAAH